MQQDNPLKGLGKPEIPKTWLLDVDGTLLNFHGTLDSIIRLGSSELPGVREFVDAIHGRGDRLILMTGRPESMRSITEKQLLEAGIAWHQLIMDVGIGVRILVNDMRKDDDRPTAAAINLQRNKGVLSILDMMKELNAEV